MGAGGDREGGVGGGELPVRAAGDGAGGGVAVGAVLEQDGGAGGGGSSAATFTPDPHGPPSHNWQLTVRVVP